MNKNNFKNKKSQFQVHINSREKADLLDLPGRKARILFSGNVLKAKDLSLIDVEIDVGACTTPAHKHETLEEVMYVLKGSAKLWIEGDVYAVNSGEAILVPEGSRHMVKNVGSSPLHMLTFYGDKSFRDGFVESPEINKDNTEF